MKIKAIRSMANSLCQMCCSARIHTSFQQMADLPDGTLQIDLLSGSCTHSSVGETDLPMVEDLTVWLSAQMKQARISSDELQSAQLRLSYKTDRVPTDRNRLILFELECGSRFALPGRLIEGHAKNLRWYDREAG